MRTDVDPDVDVHPDTHVQHMPLTSISKLAPFSGLIISIIFVILFVVKYYILEILLLPMLYGTIYNNLNELNKRGFLNHHIAGAIKLLILILAAYPFINVSFGHATLNSSFAGNSTVTMGDVLVIAAQMLIAMYIFELIYRTKISPISIVHHIGTIMVGQSAIAISLDLVHEKDADIEFILCTVWGAFDIVCEALPHVSIILYRIYPTSHRFLYRLFRAACFTTLIGTLLETAVTMYLFGSLWEQWNLAFKVVTPLLHIKFLAAQMHGTHIFWKMMLRQQRIIKEHEECDGANMTSRRTTTLDLVQKHSALVTTGVRNGGALGEQLV